MTSKMFTSDGRLVTVKEPHRSEVAQLPYRTREARSEDRPALYALLLSTNNAQGSVAHEEAEKLLNTITGNGEKHFCYVAETLEGKIIGVAFFSSKSITGMPTQGYIDHIAVSQKFRRMGIATELHNRTVDVLAANGAIAISSNMIPNSVGADRFQRKVGFSIRRVKSKDYDALHDLLRSNNLLFPKGRREFDLFFDRQYFDNMLRSKNGVCMVAESKGQVVGAYLIDINEEDGSKVARQGRLVVREDKRRQGIGTELLSAVMEECRKKGAGAIKISINVTNVPSQSMFQKAGFHLQNGNVRIGQIAFATATMGIPDVYGMPGHPLS